MAVEQFSIFVCQFHAKILSFPIISIERFRILIQLLFYYLNFARVGGFHMQGIKGAAIVVYCNPLITPQMEASDAPEG